MFEFKETISVLKLPFMDYVWMQRLSLFVCVCVCVCVWRRERNKDLQCGLKALVKLLLFSLFLNYQHTFLVQILSAQHEKLNWKILH